eukprot:CAMPEP_0171460474 /NCGR_PEP_ID=MMETSP0945-20130129/5330_1 /TAXON_ID=109269 /ORGANISM="Vaucheria litorea, Strain CCMP2940" /LENGTH=332 /DNA_ID=CAMNT_0011986673 /DNA_START=144 /DNA_END=1142 /DNA_ORIENTATION=+
MDFSEIKEVELLQQLATYLLEKSEGRSESDSGVNIEYQLHDVMEILPTLQKGLDVNVKFTHPQGFEFTEQLSLFDVATINLYHGWVVDEADGNLPKTLASLSYNQLVEKLVQYKTFLQDDSKPKANEAEKSEKFNGESRSEISRNEAAIELFLTETATQLTYRGLEMLHRDVPEGSLCVFFRNNHFSTMYRKDHSLYLLITDLGYVNQSSAVWEKLDVIDGDTEIVDSSFESRKVTGGDSGFGESVQDADHLLALQLQQGDNIAIDPTFTHSTYGDSLSDRYGTIEGDDASFARAIYEQEKEMARKSRQSETQQALNRQIQRTNSRSLCAVQ